MTDRYLNLKRAVPRYEKTAGPIISLFVNHLLVTYKITEYMLIYILGPNLLDKFQVAMPLTQNLTLVNYSVSPADEHERRAG